MCCTADQLSSNSAAGTSEQDCITQTTASYKNQLSTLQASVDQKRASYQSSKLDACLMTIQSSDCATLNVTNHVAGIPGCESFTTPLVAVGGACSQDYECINGWCNVPSSSNNGEGVCAAFVAAGQSCAAAGGAELRPERRLRRRRDAGRQLRRSLRGRLRHRGHLRRRPSVHQPQLQLERRQRDDLRGRDDAAGGDVLLQQRLLGGGRTSGRGHAAALRRVRGDRLPAGRSRAPQPLISASVGRRAVRVCSGHARRPRS